MKNLEFRARKMLRQQVAIKATKPRVRRKMKRRVRHGRQNERARL
jgi:hypothetical protein